MQGAMNTSDDGLTSSLVLNLGFGKPLLEHPRVDVVEAAMEARWNTCSFFLTEL